MNCFNITPGLIKELSYYSKCKLADHARVVDPTKVKIIGSLVLDNLGNFVSADCYVER